MYINSNGDILIGKIVKHSLIVLAGLIFIFSAVGTVGAGERGVKLRFGAVTGKTYNPGLYIKAPFVEKVVRMDVQTQKEETDATAASSDLQEVTSKIALNYSADPAQVDTIYRTIGRDYKTRIIDPAIQEAVKATTAQYTAEQLITKREEVRDNIKENLAEKLRPSGIIVEAFSIINFDFSHSFNQAIEAKVTAEQDALAAKNKLAQVQYEAQQAVEEAKGKAQAISIEANALATNPAVLQLRAIEKWNGQMPQVTGTSLPFINIK